MRIERSSIFVEDQARALAFYTEVLGFLKRTDLPAGERRWHHAERSATMTSSAP